MFQKVYYEHGLPAFVEEEVANAPSLWFVIDEACFPVSFWFVLFYEALDQL